MKKWLVPVIMSGGAAAPSVTISLSSWTAATDVAGMTITFSKEVTGFEVGDITISAGGSLANFATADNIVFTVDWTIAAGSNTMDIAAGVCTAGGINNTAAVQFGIGAAQTQTLQPAEADAVDTYIRSNQATTNFGTNGALYAGEWNGLTFTTRSLLKFSDLTTIPSNALVKSSTLTLKVKDASGFGTSSIMQIYRQLRAWVEGEATWNIYSTGNNWGTAGGFNATDCEQTNIGSTSVPSKPANDSDVVIALTPAKVQEWIDGTLTHNGFMLRTQDEANDTIGFYSSSEGINTKRPKLVTVYRVPFSAPTGVQHVQLLDCPVAADQMAFEELNGLLYFVAGRAAAAHSQKVYAYNPDDNTWTDKADYPIAVQSLVVKAVGGKLYGIGGHNSQTVTFYGDVYEYDPDANTWTAKTSMPTVREDFGAAVIGTKIYCFGGLSTAYAVTKKLEIYDTSNDTWDTTKADMPDYKNYGDFGCVYNGKIYAIGGSNTYTDYPTLYPDGSVWEYDPDTNAWTSKARLPNPQSYKEAVLLNGKIYTVAGATLNVTTYTNMVYAYDPVTNTWEQKANAPYAARGTGLAVYNNQIYMVGGYNGSMRAYLYRLGYS